MEGRVFKLTEWTKILVDKVKLKILPKRFRSKNNKKENGAPYSLNNRDGLHQQETNNINNQWGPGPSLALVSSQYEPVELSTEQPSTSTIVSPIPFPYPNTDHSIQSSVSGEDDEIPSEDDVIEYDQIQSGHYGPAEPTNDYSGMRDGPPRNLRQSSAMPYLKQPGVISIPAETSGDFHNMPDLIHQQQETSRKKKSNQRLFKCGSCGKNFKKKATLMQHELIHADSSPFVCVHCKRSFKQRATLNLHLQNHSGEKSYGCGYCDKVFRNKAILRKHIRTNQDAVHDIFGQAKSLPGVIKRGRSAGMPLNCALCPISNKEYKQKSTLRQHGCVHTESRPYPCVECGKKFRQQSHLNQHLRIHSNEKPYKCIYCQRNFRQQAILNQHLRIHTGEKPYKCLQCGKYFRQKVILDQHTRTHQG
ncbi:zinc finger protein 501-like isoform X1 [Aphis gossypii]|uniref:zinc finger protein 501-like isoform X1 n=1 Tax=Aphis gossypii TaxID=80765 RepID=UPI002158E689|nr:zinc finger protein 501-like isoform X1 [Aphis gossypii]